MVSILTELPMAIGQALGITATADQLLIGGIILSSMIVFGAAIAMNATKKMNLPVQVLGIITISGALTLIGWLPTWIMIIGLLLVAAMFGGRVLEWVGK